MTNPSKAKGTDFEAQVSRYLQVPRIGSVNGANDQGDLQDPDWVIECKNEQTIKLAEYMTELEREMCNAGKNYGVAVVKRRRSPGSTGHVGDSYAVMPLWLFRGLRDMLRVMPHG